MVALCRFWAPSSWTSRFWTARLSLRSHLRCVVIWVLMPSWVTTFWMPVERSSPLRTALRLSCFRARQQLCPSRSALAVLLFLLPQLFRSVQSRSASLRTSRFRRVPRLWWMLLVRVSLRSRLAPLFFSSQQLVFRAAMALLLPVVCSRFLHRLTPLCRFASSILVKRISLSTPAGRRAVCPR